MRLRMIAPPGLWILLEPPITTMLSGCNSCLLIIISCCLQWRGWYVQNYLKYYSSQTLKLNFLASIWLPSSMTGLSELPLGIVVSTIIPALSKENLFTFVRGDIYCLFFFICKVLFYNDFLTVDDINTLRWIIHSTSLQVVDDCVVGRR